VDPSPAFAICAAAEKTEQMFRKFADGGRTKQMVSITVDAFLWRPRWFILCGYTSNKQTYDHANKNNVPRSPHPRG